MFSIVFCKQDTVELSLQNADISLGVETSREGGSDAFLAETWPLLVQRGGSLDLHFSIGFFSTMRPVFSLPIGKQKLIYSGNIVIYFMHIHISNVEVERLSAKDYPLWILILANHRPVESSLNGFSLSMRTLPTCLMVFTSLKFVALFARHWRITQNDYVRRRSI